MNDLLHQSGVVDILEFIHNDDYLGLSTQHGDRIYQYWKNFLVYALDKDRSNILLTGGTGCGHSTIQAIIVAYYIYVISKTPRDKWSDYFDCTLHDNLEILLLSTTSGNMVFSKLINFIVNSKVLSDLAISPIDSKKDRLDFKCGVSVICDKITSSDRFHENYKNYGMNCALVSIEAYPENERTQKNCMSIICPWVANLNRNRMIISTDKAVICRPINKYMRCSGAIVSDESIWNINGLHSDSFFYVAYNNRHAEILTGDIMSHDLDGDYKILRIPEQYREDFTNNVNYAVRFIAGVDRYVIKTETGFTFLEALNQLRSGSHEDCTIFQKHYKSNNGFMITNSVFSENILINKDTGREIKVIPTEWLFGDANWCVEYSDSSGL